MRFKASIRNINTFSKLTASLASLSKEAWMRLDDNQVRFTVVPEQGTQVWAVLSIDSIFDTPYIIQSASPNNTINLQLPLAPLQRALRSATSATSASLRLTKKDNAPLLSLTIATNTLNSGNSAASFLGRDGGSHDDNGEIHEPTFGFDNRDRETIVTQDIPVRVLSAAQVEGIHEPRCRDPDVHILLPGLLQLKNISERFTKLASTADRTAPASMTASLLPSVNTPSPRLELAATMHGSLKLSIATDALNISSVWTGLSNPELDPSQVDGGEEGLREHPSTIMKGRDSSREDAWAKVRIDGKDWGRVLSVGRLGGRVIACFCHEHALILYVYLSNDDDGGDESVLTYYISSYSA